MASDPRRIKRSISPLVPCAACACRRKVESTHRNRSDAVARAQLCERTNMITPEFLIESLVWDCSIWRCDDAELLHRLAAIDFGEPCRFREFFCRFLFVAKPVKRESQVIVAWLILRFDRDRLLEWLCGQAVLLLLEVGHPGTDERTGVFRIALQGDGEVLDRLYVIALLQLRLAELVVRLCLPGLQFDGALEFGHSFLKTQPLMVDATQ